MIPHEPGPDGASGPEPTEPVWVPTDRLSLQVSHQTNLFLYPDTGDRLTVKKGPDGQGGYRILAIHPGIHPGRRRRAGPRQAAQGDLVD